jgi:putative transposase
MDDEDYRYFLGLFDRHLGSKVTIYRYKESPNYSKKLELIAYCLMPNHFHILIYQIEKDGMEKLMRSVGTAYTMYFNKKYKRVGSLFQDRYKAVMISDDSYYAHISRYIHLNPLDINNDYKTYQYSSLNGWLNDSERPNWLKPDRVKCEFRNNKDYTEFLDSYKKVKDELDVIKKDLKE